MRSRGGRVYFRTPQRRASIILQGLRTSSYDNLRLGFHTGKDAVAPRVGCHKVAEWGGVEWGEVGVTTLARIATLNHGWP